ncbi:MAG: ABC transporter ATP-binding protein, partial [Deltaproteobacteria bacterium]|nr:ABC transporter ATP-binding protein [Deltaproteobacteria bacterium]
VTELYAKPFHPYTKGLLGCIPHIGKKRKRLTPIEGNVPAPGTSQDGCSFLERCPENFAPCGNKIPPLREIDPGHLVRCWRI